MPNLDADLHSFIDSLVRENREQWKQEFLALYKTLDERKAALAALLREYNAHWKEEFQKPWHNRHLTKDIQSGLDDFNRNWYKEMQAPFHIRSHEWDSFNMTEDEFHQHVGMGKHFKGVQEEWPHGRLQYFPSLKKEQEEWYKTTYLPGEDFKRTVYGRSSYEQVVEQLKKSWLLDMMGKNEFIKGIKNDWATYFKQITRHEREEWKRQVKESVKEMQKRGASALHSILGNIDPRAQYQSFKKKVGKEIAQTLGDIRRDVSQYVEDKVNDIIDEFQEMGTRFVNGVKAKSKEFMKNQISKAGQYLKSKFPGIGKKIQNLIPSGVMKAIAPITNIVGGHLGRLANSLGLGGLFGGGGGSHDFEYGGVRSSGVSDSATINDTSTLTRALDTSKLRQSFKRLGNLDKSDYDFIDITSAGGELRDSIRDIIEDAGFVTDQYKAIHMSRNMIFINRPYLESETMGQYRSYVFFTRPNCNLISEGKIPIEIVAHPEFKAMMLSDPELYAELCRDGAEKSNLFYLLSNYCKEVPPIRLSESMREGVKNMYDKSMPLPGNPEIYDTFDIAVTFMDNNRGDISKLMYALSMYKDLVGKQGYPMRPEYHKYRSIDYLMSMYVVTVDMDWNVVGFGAALNMIAAEPATHFTQHKMDGFSKTELLEDFTVNFKATTWIPYAPHLFDHFNKLFGFNSANLVDPHGANGYTLHADTRSDEIASRESTPTGTRSVFRDPNKTVHIAMKNPGVFEYTALHPGFYRLPDVTETNRNIHNDRRPKIKFGFSWS